jgi:dTDP-4-dehydrorhamnose 3,5-epimerase
MRAQGRQKRPMVEIRRLALPDVLLITPVKHGDSRGFFSETYSRRRLAEAGFDKVFVQDNHSLSGKRGILRGLHFQRAPHMQDKLVRVARGAVFDVAVDIRKGSPSFGQWVGAELSDENWRQMLVPAGFAHGFLTLTDTAEVLYKVTDDYAPDCEGGLAWNDPAIGIDWPLPVSEILTNARDGQWPKLAELEPL